MGDPQPHLPIGLRLTQTARVAAAAFEQVMAEAGGSASLWQVLLLVRSRQWGNQSSMAEAMGVTSATLTHHLNAAERQGLVRRWREPDNRRVQRVELTDEGVAMFDRLRGIAVAHDERLRGLFDDEELERFGAYLDRVRTGLSADGDAGGGA
jgi:MarR family transcriptional regulator for hemolysin